MALYVCLEEAVVLVPVLLLPLPQLLAHSLVEQELKKTMRAER